MTKARQRETRAQLVAQAALVWQVLDDSTTGEHLAAFVETGELEATPEVVPYNPMVMAEIAKNWQS